MPGCYVQMRDDTAIYTETLYTTPNEFLSNVRFSVLVTSVSFEFYFLHLLDNERKCVFTALHAMQTRYCEENSVRPSVHLSVRSSHA